MDPRGFDDIGLDALSAIGQAILGQPVPSTVAWSQTWSAQHHPVGSEPMGQGSGFRDQISGPLFITPQEILTRESLVDGKFKTMDADVHANVVNNPTFVANWSSFKASWDSFLQSHQSTASLLLTGTGTVDRQITAFENELEGWRNALAQIAPGAHLSTPPITTTQGQTIAPNASTVAPTTGLPWWGVALLTVGGLAVVGYLGYRAYEKYSPSAIAFHKLAGSYHGHEHDADYARASGEYRPRYPHIPVYGY